MSDLNPSPFEGFEEEPLEPTLQDEAPQKGGGNRNFMVALGVIGGIFLIAVIALVLLVVLRGPQSAAQRANAVAEINAQNTATSQVATNEALKAFLAMTPSATPVPPTNTPEPTGTSPVIEPTATSTPEETATEEMPVVIEMGTAQPAGAGTPAAPADGTGAGTPAADAGTPAAPALAGDVNNRTATVAAFLTQAAGGGAVLTLTPQSTALPNTGFADEVGLPGLFGLAAALLVVVFLARRARLANQS